MNYLLLIYTDENLPEPEPDERAKSMQAWFDYTDALTEAGVNIRGDALMPTNTATTVRVRNDETLTTDGPFAETKEALGGYYLIDVADLDEAIRWASRCPAAIYGSVEVRPVMDVTSLEP